MVYFVLAKGLAKVKIGYSSKKTSAHRVRHLQIASPVELLLLGEVEGDVETERHFHGRFQRYHLRGEWFTLGKELQEFLETKFGKLPDLSEEPLSGVASYIFETEIEDLRKTIRRLSTELGIRKHQVETLREEYGALVNGLCILTNYKPFPTDYRHDMQGGGTSSTLLHEGAVMLQQVQSSMSPK